MRSQPHDESRTGALFYRPVSRQSKATRGMLIAPIVFSIAVGPALLM